MKILHLARFEMERLLGVGLDRQQFILTRIWGLEFS